MNSQIRIPVIYSEEHTLHNPPFEIYDGVKESYAEKAERLHMIVSSLREQGVVIEEPLQFSRRNIENLHQKAYVDFVQRRSESLQENDVLYPSYFLMDTYTPLTPGTYRAALSSVNVALTGAEKILQGEHVVYSLCRPPGHHAEQKAMGGYCYFNNAAIAANYLSQKGTVAILDIDFHHGNGTQQLFYERSDVLYVSLHADPKVRFPYSSGFASERGQGKGEGYTKNYPLPLGTTDEDYLQVLRKALSDIQTFSPDFLVVSLGFDTYEKDPIGGFSLTIPFYQVLGKEVMGLSLPTVLIQEGGYNISQLGNMAVRFLHGVQSRLS